MNPTTVFACENQPVVVEGLFRVFDSTPDIALAGHATEIDGAVRGATDANADVLLVGQPPAMKSVLPLLAQARTSGTHSAIVLWVTDLSDMDAFRALQMGARGVITRTERLDVLIECIRTVKRGTVWLQTTLPAIRYPYRQNPTVRITPREREIIEYVCQGMKNKEIAEALSITPGTVKVHLMHIFEKTGTKDRFQLALQGRQILGAGMQTISATVGV